MQVSMRFFFFVFVFQNVNESWTCGVAMGVLDLQIVIKKYFLVAICYLWVYGVGCQNRMADVSACRYLDECMRRIVYCGCGMWPYFESFCVVK